MSKQQVLIVDDDPKYRALLSETFSDLEVSTAKNGKDAIALIGTIVPDIIILDIVMPDMDGFDACKAIRSIRYTASTPIVFYSGMDSLEGKLKAYDLGGNDFIGKDAQHAEIRAKVMRLLSSEQERLAIKQELEAGNHLLENMQKETSALHLISQFSQACQFCYDYETMATVLFNCLFKLNLRGVVYFRNENRIFSSNGSNSKLEEEILRDSVGFGRIYSFGENRVILNWDTCSLLVKDVGDNLDTLAHLMGAVQTGIRTLEVHSKMLEKVLSVEAKYRELKSRLSEQGGDSKNLKEQLFESGLVSRFDIQDEQDLDKLLEPYGNDLVDIFVDAEDSVAEITKLLKLIHVPPPELKDLFVKRRTTYLKQEPVDDDILF